ncbi:lantibiotic immunity ABC transporter MutG family permease subunit [Metaclostridioides mangenotii]|uniref:lantibiotic immunity ABC transporter MutG family permease subunit n=1 Tax=Metaclostridioides mangenotii TaxID=1540 RepID=UPI00046345D3|nr:lantibiotic immunity ABC transporter MutG family permease subunit [Clostridioides mangenotii]
MDELYRCLKSDFYKLRHTSVLKLHIVIPVAISFIFLMYFKTTNYKISTMVSAYLEVVAVGFPLIISIMTSLVVDQEEGAGQFQVLLASTKKKSVTFLSKLTLLICLAIISVVISVGIFGIGIKGMSIYFYIKSVLYLVVSNIFIYILHLILSLKFGKGASIGVGLVGTLTSALMLTGLGQKIWSCTPWAWGGRFSDYIVLQEVDRNLVSIVSAEIKRGLIPMCVLTVLILIFSTLWFKGWEGRKVYE